RVTPRLQVYPGSCRNGIRRKCGDSCRGAEWCCSFAACHVFRYVAFNRAILHPSCEEHDGPRPGDCQVMIILGRHRALTRDAWSEFAVRSAIEDMVTD